MTRATSAGSKDLDVKKKEAAQALARYVSLHPHNVAQKVEVIVEHFRKHAASKIGGRAKAMVVTRSRLHAVRFKLAFEAYIAKRGYTDVGALVAFSGTVTDPETDTSYTETGMNAGQSTEGQLPEMFASDQWQVLIVANKYQTGFDQPLLHTMYVDRRLAGVQAVQDALAAEPDAPGQRRDLRPRFRERRGRDPGGVPALLPADHRLRPSPPTRASSTSSSRRDEGPRGERGGAPSRGAR